MKFKLSRSATIISKQFSETYFASQEIKRISQIIGQYAGTDMYHTPGDHYVQKRVYKQVTMSIVPRSRQVWPARMYFVIKEYNIYRVLSRTPCTVKCKHIHSVYVLKNKMRHSYYQRLHPDEILDREYTFYLKHTNGQPIHPEFGDHIFRPNTRRCSEIEQEFNDLNLNISTLPDISLYQLYFGHTTQVAFNYNNQQLVRLK